MSVDVGNERGLREAEMSVIGDERERLNVRTACEGVKFGTPAFEKENGAIMVSCGQDFKVSIQQLCAIFYFDFE
jgi:hypothetical protein